jgi:hypothetical protein
MFQNGTPLIVVALVLILVGCKTAQIDWSKRVGTYTYDQAVMEFGPPDKRATLEDGSIVAEWLLQRGRTDANYWPSPYYGYYGYYYGPIYPSITTTSWPDQYLRLIFNPEHRLADWRRFAR